MVQKQRRHSESEDMDKFVVAKYSVFFGERDKDDIAEDPAPDRHRPAG